MKLFRFIISLCLTISATISLVNDQYGNALLFASIALIWNLE